MASRTNSAVELALLRSKAAGVVLAHYWQANLRGNRRYFIGAGGILAILLAALAVFNISYEGKVLPGLIIGGVTAGGLTKEELGDRLGERIQAVDGKELKATVDGKDFVVVPTADWGVSYDVEDTVSRAFRIGRRGNLFVSVAEQLTVLFTGKSLGATLSIRRDAARAWVDEITAAVESPEQDARLVLSGNSLTIEPEKVGRRIPNDLLFQSTTTALATLDFSAMAIVLSDQPPAVTVQEATFAKPAVTRMITNDLLLKFEDKSFRVTPPDLLGFIELAADEAAADGVITLVNESKVKNFLETIARDIDQTAVDARLTIEGGKASVFTPSQDGYRVNREEAARDMADALEKRRADTSVTELTLAVEVTKAAVRTETINDLGIKELIGKATTSFTGSPPNRVHNITVGANQFNGLLIKPGETFSTVGALGNVDASTGYRAELVIKEDRLIPETGGGLCQVSSTLFRTALNSGLAIVERKNHSFRVRYYEPPVGMDATIYDPAPDLKFKNDTPAYILIQTKIEGTKLTFEFYGTKDGREVTLSTPVVYNITEPGEPVYIEDPSLPPGEQRQIEKPVPGADAHFTYTVTKDGQTLHNKTFTSHYVAWKAKFLVGPAAPPAEPPAQPPAEPAAAPTPPPA